MPAILAIAANDLRLLVRDKAALFFTLFFPLGLAVFFGAIFGGGSGGGSRLDVALVLEEDGPRAQAFAAALAADTALDVVRQTEEGTPLTRAQGERMVQKGAVSACVVVPRGFDGGIESLFAGGGIRLEGYVAPGRGAEAGLLTGKLNELAFRQMASGFSDPAEMTGMLDRARSSVGGDAEIPDENRRLLTGMFDRIDEVNKALGGINPGAARGPGAAQDGASGGAGGGTGGWMPVQVSLTELKDESDRPRSSWEVSFPQGVVWALMGCVTGFGVSMSGERSRGTLLRLSVAPISRGQLLLGKAGACFFACLAVQALLIALAVGVFGGMMGQFRVGNPLMLGAAMTVSAIGFTGLMMLLAGLTRTEGGASGLGRGLIIVLAMIGGGSIPLFLLPGWVQTASSISPFKWATISIEGAIWRGFTWADCALPFGVLLGCGVVGFAIGASALRPAERA